MTTKAAHTSEVWVEVRKRGKGKDVKGDSANHEDGMRKEAVLGEHSDSKTSGIVRQRKESLPYIYCSPFAKPYHSANSPKPKPISPLEEENMGPAASSICPHSSSRGGYEFA